MNLNRLYQILRETTVAMNHESQAKNDIENVDLHFIVVGVDKPKAEQIKDEFIAILKTYPQPDRLARGLSYIEVGGEIGDQGAALQLFALGKVLGLWDIITPEKLGFTGHEAAKMAGSGLVMMSGFKAA